MWIGILNLVAAISAHKVFTPSLPLHLTPGLRAVGRCCHSTAPPLHSLPHALHSRPAGLRAVASVPTPLPSTHSLQFCEQWNALYSTFSTLTFSTHALHSRLLTPCRAASSGALNKSMPAGGPAGFRARQALTAEVSGWLLFICLFACECACVCVCPCGVVAWRCGFVCVCACVRAV